MTKEQILSEVANSDWQPEFEFTEDLDAVVDSILKPHEDYFLGLHSKLKEIIKAEIEYAERDDHENRLRQVPSIYQITFADVCNWQKELFEYKTQEILNVEVRYMAEPSLLGLMKRDRTFALPNQHITLGLRTTNVEVNGWNPPHPMFLEELKEMCFPLKIDKTKFQCWIFGIWFIFSSDKTENNILNGLTEWYKIFETIHFFEDLNGRLGGIVINVLSYLLTGKYLIKK